MELRKIGGLEVSVAGLGTNNFGRRLDAAATRRVVAAALDAGVTHFDTADIYGEGRSEEYLGRALAARRGEVTIASKFGYHGPPQGARTLADWVPQALEATLRRLGTDRLDLFYYHKPDRRAPIGDTLEVLNGLLERGLVREIGCSNFSIAQLDEAARVAAEAWAARFCRPRERVQPHREGAGGRRRARGGRGLGMAFVPFFPLASGLLSGAYRRGRPTPQGSRLRGRPTGGKILSSAQLDMVERLAEFAEAHGHTLLELSLSYLAAHAPVATVIAGATSRGQVRANAAATGAWPLTADELAEIGALLG